MQPFYRLEKLITHLGYNVCHRSHGIDAATNLSCQRNARLHVSTEIQLLQTLEFTKCIGVRLILKPRGPLSAQRT